MIAADTSTLIAFLAGESGRDVQLLDEALARNALRLPPVVVTELLSDAKSRSALFDGVIAAPMLEVLPDYWARAGATRAALITKGLRARLPDALIAQSCLDHDVPLITRDADFRHFEKHCGLKLA